jgi:hypothetical protein
VSCTQQPTDIRSHRSISEPVSAVFGLRVVSGKCRGWGLSVEARLTPSPEHLGGTGLYGERRMDLSFRMDRNRREAAKYSGGSRSGISR